MTCKLCGNGPMSIVTEYLLRIVAAAAAEYRSRVPTFSGAHVASWLAERDLLTEATMISACRRARTDDISGRHHKAGYRYVTDDGYTRLPEQMVLELQLGRGGYLWFLRGPTRWEAWLESELDQLFGVDKC